MIDESFDVENAIFYSKSSLILRRIIYKTFNLYRLYLVVQQRSHLSKEMEYVQAWKRGHRFENYEFVSAESMRHLILGVVFL